VTTPTLHHVSPIFQVANLDRAIAFYTQVMGFELAWSWGTPPDRAAICRDSIEITLEVAAQPRTSHVYVQVNGVNEYFAKVTAGGASVIYPLTDRIYGMRDGRVADPDGNHINLGERIES
jgi:uncharacterized glyoxalase superfamily protein PhnB